nr:hypothetical protein [Tanacetum cinerariifolium]
MSMSVHMSQVYKTTIRAKDDDKRLCLVDDLKEVQDHIHIEVPVSDKNEGEPSYVGEPDTQPMLLTYADVQAILLSEDEAQERKEDILGPGEEMDDNPQDQTDQLVETSISSFEKSSSTINDLYKDITNSVKDDPAINKKIEEASKTLAKISTRTTEILSSVRVFDFSTLWSTVKNIQDHAFKQEEASAAWMKSSTNMA